MSRFVRSLLFALLTVLAVSGCTERTSEPAAGSVPLHVEVKFEDGPGGAPLQVTAGAASGESYQIESITARASSYDKETNRLTLQDERTVEISPEDTRFELSLAVPSGDNYTIVVTAQGRQTDSDERGVLYSGSAFLETVSVDTENRAEVALEFLVPSLSVVSSDESYRVTWSFVSEALRYQLFELDTASNEIRQFNVVGTDTTFTFPPRFMGDSERQYRVRGEFAGGSTTVPSNQVNVPIPAPIAPDPINDLRVSLFSQNEVSLTWTATGDDGIEGTAAEYDLRQSTEPITTANFDDTDRLLGLGIPGLAGSTETFVVENLLPDTRYHFAIRATDDAGIRSLISNVAIVTTLPSNDDVTPPDPVVLNGSELRSDSVRLNWTAPGDDGAEGTATRYELRRSLSPITEREFPNGDLIDTPTPGVAGTAQSVVATGLSPETQYYFAIRAYDEANNASQLTAVLEVLTPGEAAGPSAVTDLVAIAAGQDAIDLSWTSPAIGTAPLLRYELRVSTLPITPENFPDADLLITAPPRPPGTAESLRAIGLTADRTYYFAMITIDSASEGSPLSNIASATTLDLTPPAGTTDLAATILSETSAELRWTAPGDDGDKGQAALYELRRATFPITTENFPTADRVTTDVPSSPGATELVTETDLVAGVEYSYALITEDESGNRSTLSNIIVVLTDDETPPSNVANLIATAISGSTVRLTWTAPGDDGPIGQASAYDLRYNTTPITVLNFEESSPILTGTPSPSGTLESVERDGFSSDTYFFALRTEDDNGNVSGLSNVAMVTFDDTTVPNAILDLAASDVNATSALLSWTAPGDDGIVGRAASYDLRRSNTLITPANFEGAIIVTGVGLPDSSGTAQSFAIGMLEPSTIYYFAIRSADGAGNRSAISNVASIETLPAPPNPPTGLIALALDPNSIELTWNDNSTDEDEFDIEVLVEGESEFMPLDTTPGSAGSSGTYITNDLTDRTEYSFRVRASNISGPSAYSNTATVRTPVPAPRSLTAIAIGEDLVDLSWSFPFADPDSFRIEREDDAIWDAIATITGTDRGFGDSTVEFLTSYNYRVLAIDGTVSESSNIVSVTTPDEAAVCSIVPSSLDFGDIELGTSAIDSVTITNTGGAVLVGTAVFQSCPHFRTISGDGPFGLGRGQSRIVRIEYDPITAGSHSCNLLTGSTCDQVPISGSASEPMDNFWWDGFEAHPSGQGLNAEVRSMVVTGSKMIVGGAFDDAGGVIAHRVVSWSGTSWVREETDNNFLSGGPVSSVSFYDDGKNSFIVAGGSFDGGPGGPTRYTERISGEWQAYSEIPNLGVRATLPDGFNVWVGGLFTDISGAVPSLQHYLSIFSDDTWIPVGDFNAPVYALTKHEGSVIAGGSFDLIDGSPRNHIAQGDIEDWSALGLGLNGPVYVLASIDGYLYAGGDFTVAGTGPAKGIARWDGYSWSGIGGDIDFGVVYAIEKFDGDIVIGGDFETENGSGAPLKRIAVYDGTEWTGLGPGIGNGVVNSLRSFQGSLYAGGSFISAGLKPSSYIARWDPPRARR